MSDERIKLLAEAAAVEILAAMITRCWRLASAWHLLDGDEQTEELNHWIEIIAEKLKEATCS